MKAESLIKDLIKTNALTVSREQTLSEVLGLFDKHSIRHLVVVDSDDSVVGILSQHDVFKRLLKLSMETTGSTMSHLILDNTLINEIMTPDPVVIDAYDTIDVAIEILAHSSFHALPVTDDGRLRGLITAGDIVEASLEG